MAVSYFDISKQKILGSTYSVNYSLYRTELTTKHNNIVNFIRPDVFQF